MRIYLKTTRNTTIVPFNHLPILVGTVHKWLGQNNWHNQISLHSFSWLKGGRPGNNGLFFPFGAEWFISSHNQELLKKLIQGIQTDPQINYGLAVTSINIQDVPNFGGSQTFTLASPILIKRRDGDKIRHHLFSDEKSNDFMTETLITKLNKAGLYSDGVRVVFNKDFPYAKTKLVNYNGIGNRANFCPITITGSPEQIAFAWNVGIGNSTGIGFGALT